ncbi:MAG: NUDIX hydrolase [Ktedonobacteraceae bacterium]
MKEKIKGLLAGMIFRFIALLTLGRISPILSACVIIERDGKILFIDRSDGLGYAIPGGIVRYRETVEQCIIREAREETRYDVAVCEFVGVYSALRRDPRLRAIALVYKGAITGGKEQGSGEGPTGWYAPGDAFGHMAFDCESMIKDYLSGKQRLS